MNEGDFKMERIGAEAFVANYATFEEYGEIEYDGVKFLLRETIGFMQMMEIVETVVRACFITDGSYRPEFKDFMLRCEVLEKYTNIDLPSDINEQYDIVYKSGIFGHVVSCINKEQLGIIIKNIDDRIDYNVNSNVMRIEEKISEIYTSVKNMIDTMEKSLGDINSAEMSKLIRSLSGESIDTEALAKAIVESMRSNDKE